MGRVEGLAWQRVRGHDAHVAGFSRAVQRGRLAHAYLLTGPRGIGKRTFALELARALLCEAPRKPGEPTLLEACGHCPACIQVEAGTHPDCFTAARPEESPEFPIGLMRELCKSFALKSARGRGKVILLDDADDLNEEAANCFLKTLEEPPPGSVLLLIGTSPDRQLPTIVSRCQVLRFAPLPLPLVDEVLRAQGVEDAALRGRLVRVSGGSPGQALEWAEPELWEFRGVLLRDLARAGGPTPKVARAWMDFVEQAGKESAPQRRRAGWVLRLLVDFLGDAMALSVGGAPRRTAEADLSLLQALALRAGPDRLLGLMERCLEAERHIQRNIQLVLALEALLDALAQQLGR
jgi:DNA polymerase-3 subunit delta'